MLDPPNGLLAFLITIQDFASLVCLNLSGIFVAFDLRAIS
jgi:hypothetical protein